MPRCRKRSFFVISPFLIFLLLFCFELHYWIMQPPDANKWPEDPCQSKLVNGTITALKSNKTFIISSYRDAREQNLTRVIAIVHYKKVEDLYCWYCCGSDSHISIIRAAIDIHSERFGMPFGAADIMCSEPQNCSPEFVSVHPSPKGGIEELQRFRIKNRTPEYYYSAEFTVCLFVGLENQDNVLQVLQSIEMYKILGAQKMVLYMSNCSQLMEQFLKLYVDEGTVEMIPWPITTYINFSLFQHTSMDLHYGKISVLNDCVYRNMYRSKYVVLNDIDEIVLPIKHPNWKAMIKSLEEQNPETGIYFFESNFFPQSVFSSVDKSRISLWETVPGVNILEHIYRMPNRMWLNNPRKMIVNPRKVVQTSIHSILKGYGRTMEVPRDLAILYTCKLYSEKDLLDQYLIRDTSIWRFNDSLINSVNQVLIKFEESKPPTFFEKLLSILK